MRPAGASRPPRRTPRCRSFAKSSFPLLRSVCTDAPQRESPAEPGPATAAVCGRPGTAPSPSTALPALRPLEPPLDAANRADDLVFFAAPLPAHTLGAGPKTECQSCREGVNDSLTRVPRITRTGRQAVNRYPERG